MTAAVASLNIAIVITVALIIIYQLDLRIGPIPNSASHIVMVGPDEQTFQN
ncbi:hypothetical protein [Amycolatopsis sp. cmx-11-12]|uniref:hypothetical protein n=1 Tax=Amycolatopsis sp. cmx-11-12 TaxID=2785795 RepID=UPI003917C7B1